MGPAPPARGWWGVAQRALSRPNRDRVCPNDSTPTRLQSQAQALVCGRRVRTTPSSPTPAQLTGLRYYIAHASQRGWRFVALFGCSRGFVARARAFAVCALWWSRRWLARALLLGVRPR